MFLFSLQESQAAPLDYYGMAPIDLWRFLFCSLFPGGSPGSHLQDGAPLSFSIVAALCISRVPFCTLENNILPFHPQTKTVITAFLKTVQRTINKVSWDGQSYKHSNNRPTGEGKSSLTVQQTDLAKS